MNDLDDSLAPPRYDGDLSVNSRLMSISDVFLGSTATITMMDAKHQYKLLALGCGILLQNHQLRDPQVAAWMLNPADRVKNLQSLVRNNMALPHLVLRKDISLFPYRHWLSDKM